MGITSQPELALDFTVFGNQLEADYSLTDVGVHVGGDFNSAVFDGTFHPASFDDSHITRDYSSIPYFDPNGKQV